MKRAIVLTAFLAFFQLQGPSPSEAKQGQPKQDGGTQKAEKIEQVQPPPKTCPPAVINNMLETNTDDGNRNIKQRASADWWFIGFYTALTIVSILQFCAMRKQATYMRKGLVISLRASNAARRAAHAAKQSADTTINLERPWILVRPMEVSVETVPSKREGQWRRPKGFIPYGADLPYTPEEVLQATDPVYIEYTIRNYGRSPGWLLYHWGTVKMLLPDEVMPEKPDYTVKPTCFDGPDRRLVEPRRRFRNSIRIPLSQYIQLRERQRKMYVYGYIRYRDVWKNEHETAFSFYFHVPGDGDINPLGFYPEPDACNYET